MADLTPQAALEQAVVNLMRTAAAANPPGLGYQPLFCGRRFDGRPPPNCPRWYAAVWSENAVRAGESRAQLTALDESYDLYVTLTVPLVRPFDRWHEHRDELEARADEVRAMIHKDVCSNVILNAANVLAGFRGAGSPDNVRRAGFFRGLAYSGRDPVQEVGPEWFMAEMDTPRPPVGIAQRIRFAGAMRLQDLATMA